MRGINASLDLIRETRGGTWPTGPVTEEENYVDLVWHECEFRDGKSFTFCVEAEAAAISAAHISSRVARNTGPSNRSTRQQGAGCSEILDAPPSDLEITCRTPR